VMEGNGSSTRVGAKYVPEPNQTVNADDVSNGVKAYGSDKGDKGPARVVKALGGAMFSNTKD
jgi:hypothetical protein